MNENIEKLTQELEKTDGITNRLQHYKENYYLKYKRNPQKLMDIFKCSKLTTTLKVPETIYHNFFEPNKLDEFERIKYYNWWVDFLAEYARFCFPLYKKEIDEITQLKSPEKFLQKELNKIEAFEHRVDKLYEEGKVSFGDTSNGPYADELIYLKLTQGHYERKYLEELEYKFQDIAQVKAKYIFAKRYIKSMLQEDVTSAYKRFHHLFLPSVENPKSLTEKLKEYYTNKKPKEMALMLFALRRLELIKPDILSGNKCQLYSILKKEYNIHGQYRSLTKAMSKLSEPLPYEESNIQAHIETIEKLKQNIRKK